MVIDMDQNTVGAEEAQKMSPNELLKKLLSSEKGLSTSEAQDRIRQVGYNEIEEKKISPLLKFLGYFWGPIPWMIEAAAVLSAIISHWEDFGIICALLLLNAVVGFWQEHKADDAIELLKQNLAPNARVLRDGKWSQIAAKELVPGDVVRVRLGDIVPADLKLMKGDYLSVDQSALTGESLPVEKKVSDVAYSGSIVRQGVMDAVVSATGMNSYFGKTAKLVEEARTRSHFQKAVIKIGDYLIILGVALVTLIFFVALFRHESLVETLQFALVLTIAAIPVALPAVLSVTMAVGAMVLAKKQAIVSKLVAIEEMAGMDVLCSDKTGTITENKLTVGGVEAFEGFRENDVLLFAALASKEDDRDPLDDAVIAKLKVVKELAEEPEKYETTEFTPFDPTSKRAVATVEDREGNRFKVAKGAPQAVLALMEDQESLADRVDGRVNTLASNGYRPLGVATTKGDGNWKYIGMIGLYDPPREDSAETIRAAQDMGVQVKMVTGDHTAIAKEIARQVNLGTDIKSVSTFIGKPDREAGKAIEDADGFAQVFPEHKYHIVELLQDRGHIVGMTGDGVNDAPALKKADAGIAVAGATDAAKSAADIVFTMPGLSVIIDAIKESRKIFQRMNNYAVYRIAETIRVLFFMTLSILVFQFYPITAVMIVLLALLNDAPIMSIAYDNVNYAEKPEKWNMRLVLSISTLLGLMGVVTTFALLYIGLEVLHLDKEALQTLIYLKLSVAGHLTVFLARTRGPFWSIKPSRILFLAVIVTQAIATLISVYGVFITPIGWKLAGFVWVYALVTELLILDFAKVRLYKVLEHGEMKFKR